MLPQGSQQVDILLQNNNALITNNCPVFSFRIYPQSRYHLLHQLRTKTTKPGSKNKRFK